MRKILLATCALLALVGCGGTGNVTQKKAAIQSIKQGESKQQIIQKLGLPGKIEQKDKGKEVLYYCATGIGDDTYYDITIDKGIVSAVNQRVITSEPGQLSCTSVWKTPSTDSECYGNGALGGVYRDPAALAAYSRLMANGGGEPLSYSQATIISSECKHRESQRQFEQTAIETSAEICKKDWPDTASPGYLDCYMRYLKVFEIIAASSNEKHNDSIRKLEQLNQEQQQYQTNKLLEEQNQRLKQMEFQMQQQQNACDPRQSWCR